MKYKPHRIRSVQITTSLLVADIIVFTVVNPRQASAPWLIIGYILFSLTIVSLASVLAYGLKPYGERIQRTGKRFLRYSALVLIALTGLQSIGQLTAKDIAAMLPLVLLAYIYFGYGRKTVSEQT